jgi:hypothetical protein
VKTRRFGGYSNYHRERYLAECRDLLRMTKSVEPTTTDTTPQKPNQPLAFSDRQTFETPTR